MNISNSAAAFTQRASSSRPQGLSQAGGSPQKGEEQLSAALKSIGVDDTTAANVIEQIDEAIAALSSESSTSSNRRPAIRAIVDEVLEANGIDAAEVGDAIRANRASEADQTTGANAVGGAGRAGGGRGAGRPNGPPPPRREQETEIGAVESALLSSGVDESSSDDLINQIIETIQQLTSEASNSVSQNDIRSALTSLLEENGVDFDGFEQTLNTEIGSSGSFLNRLV